MQSDASIAIGLVVTVVAVAALVGLGTLLGFRRRTRAAGNSAKTPAAPRDEPSAAELRERDLKYCLHLADCLGRDADLLSAMAARPTPPSMRDLLAALAPLLKTTRCLEGRLRRVGSGEPPPSSAPTVSLDGLAAEKSPWPDLPPAPSPGALAASATATVSDGPPAYDFDDRKYPRSPCRGSFKATIYPPPSKPGGEPVQCTVLTRDISCGGIGIAHTEELFPKQIIVLHAVTKLLIGEVRWCRRMSERSYIAGCQLIKASG